MEQGFSSLFAVSVMKHTEIKVQKMFHIHYEKQQQFSAALKITKKQH